MFRPRHSVDGTAESPYSRDIDAGSLGRGRGKAGAPLIRARGTLLLPAFPAA